MSTIYTDPPQSRNEAIIKSTIDGTQYTDPPQSRMEDLLLDLKEAIEGGGGGGTTVVANPEGEATDELEKLQVGNDIYGISKDYEDLDNKPQINGETLDGNKTASELGLQAELDGAQTVSGNPITVADAEAMNAESVVVELEPKQDLHGYDAPWVGGSGKNKLDEDYSTNYTNAVKLPAGTYYYQGFVGDVPSRTNTRLEFSEDNSTWEMVGIPSTDARITTSGWDGGWLESGIATMTFTTTAELYFRVWIVEGTLDNRHLSISSEQLTTFAPYSNICPITGYSEVNLERVGKNWCPYDKITTNASGYFTLASGGYTFSFKCLGTPKYSTSKIILRDANNNDLVFVPYTVTPVGSYLSGTFTISESTSCQILNENVNVDSSGYAIDNIQIEIGNQATTYEPYQGSTATISLGGTKYGGTLDVTEGGYSDEWGYIEGDSVSDLVSAGMSSDTTSAGLYCMVLPSSAVSQADDQTATSDKLVCNDMENITANQSWGTNVSGICINQVGHVIFTVKDITTQADMNTWLSNNPIQIAYRKKTPSSASTTPTDIPLLENTNNVSTDGTNITLKYQPNNVIGECKVYTDEQCAKVLPPLPTTDGTYHLSCEVTSGVGVLSWVSDS